MTLSGSGGGKAAVNKKRDPGASIGMPRSHDRML